MVGFVQKLPSKIRQFFSWLYVEYPRACEAVNRRYRVVVEGRYYSNRHHQLYVALRVQGKRGLFHKPILDVFNDKVLLSEINPAQAVMIGYFARREEERNLKRFLKREKTSGKKHHAESESEV